MRIRASGLGACAPFGAPVVVKELSAVDGPWPTAPTYVVFGRRSTVTAFPDATVASRNTWPSALMERGLERDWRSSSTVTPGRNVARFNSPCPLYVKRVGPAPIGPEGSRTTVPPDLLTATVGTDDWAAASVTGTPTSTIAPMTSMTLRTCQVRRAGRVPRASMLAGRMARTWHELFLTGEDAPAPAADPDTEPERRGFFRRLRENRSKTRQALGAELQATVFQSLDDEAFEHLEETLIYADVGAPTTAKIVERLEAEAESGELTGGEDLARRLRELLADTARVDGDRIALTERPAVILVVGVNGSGKTTTIGKIAWHL